MLPCMSLPYLIRKRKIWETFESARTCRLSSTVSLALQNNFRRLRYQKIAVLENTFHLYPWYFKSLKPVCSYLSWKHPELGHNHFDIPTLNSHAQMLFWVTATSQGIWGPCFLKATEEGQWWAKAGEELPMSSLSCGKPSCYLTWLRQKQHLGDMHVILSSLFYVLLYALCCTAR